MSRTVLDCLGSVINVNGDEALGRRVPRERTHVERVAIRMHERRQETWRPLNQERVGAFLQMYLLAMVYVENAHRNGRQHEASTKMLNRTLVRRIIPWIYQNRAWTRDDSQWPLSLDNFHELDRHLTSHLPRVRATHQWQMIRVYFEEMEQQQQDEELTEEEEEAGERNYLEWKNSAENNLNYSNEDD